MGVPAEVQKRVAADPPPRTAMVQAQAREYLGRAGMLPQDLAHEIGYSTVAVRMFFSGARAYKKYAGADDLYIRRAVWQYLEQHPLAGGDDDAIPTKLLPTRDTELILERIRAAHENARIVVIEGPPGTSKTTVLKWYWAERNRARAHDTFYIRCWSQIRGTALLHEICRLTAAYAHGTRERLLRNAVRKLKEQRPAVLLIDECQYLLDESGQAFEQLRDVLDLAGCGCVLAGHFNFLRQLTNGMGKILEQWLSRIDMRDHLRGLIEDEIGKVAGEYLGEELPVEVRRELIAYAYVRDRNAFLRAQAFSEPIQRKYLSIRRVKKFLERIEDLRAIPSNAQDSLAALARAAAKQLMAPEGKPL